MFKDRREDNLRRREERQPTNEMNKKQIITESSHDLAEWLLSMPDMSIRVPKVEEYDDSLDMLPLHVTQTTIYKDHDDAADKIGGFKALIVSGKGN